MEVDWYAFLGLSTQSKAQQNTPSFCEIHALYPSSIFTASYLQTPVTLHSRLTTRDLRQN